MDRKEPIVSRSDDVERDIVRMLMCTDRLHKTLIEARMEKFGLHRSQFALLRHLSECKSPPTQKDLADRMAISPAAASGIVSSLLANGCISREKDGTDARAYKLCLSEKGRDILKQSRAIFAQTDRQMLSALSSDEKKELCLCLEKLLQSLRAMQENAGEE